MEKRMVMEKWSIQMEKFLMENGKMANNMAQEK